MAMSDEQEPRPITPLWQRQDWIEKLVRRIAANADNIAFTLHTFEREGWNDKVVTLEWEYPQ